MKSIIYCRVSTKEQAEQGYSLEGQERECRKFADKCGYSVEKIFIEKGESAQTQDRTQLNKLLQYTIKNKNELNALIIWKLDRLTRSLCDLMELFSKFSSFGIRILSVTENNENTSSGKLMRNIIGSFAQYENDVRAERTIGGMKRAIESGRWCWQAPLGYKYIRDAHNKPILTPTDESEFVIKAFELFGTGLYKQAPLAKELKKLGFKKATKSLVNRMLNQPLYAGLIRSKWDDELHEGIHPALISKDLFYKTQAILKGKRPSITPHVRNNPHFPLRGFIRCPKCGKKLTGGFSTGRKGVKYPYYHCFSKNCSLSVKKDELESNFYKHLQRFQPKEEILKKFEAKVLDAYRKKQTEQLSQERRLSLELLKLEKRKDKIFDLMVNGTIAGETYKAKTEEIKTEIFVKHVELTESKIDLNDVEGCLNYCRYFLSNLADLWANADLNLKQRFQTLIFPDKIYYENGTFRTTETALIFKQLQVKSPEELQLVAPAGFEPASDD